MGVSLRGSGWCSSPSDCSVWLCCGLAFVVLLTVASGRTSLVLRIICWWLEASCGRLSAPSCCVFTLLAHHPVSIAVPLFLPCAFLCCVCCAVLSCRCASAGACWWPTAVAGWGSPIMLCICILSGRLCAGLALCAVCAVCILSRVVP